MKARKCFGPVSSESALGHLPPVRHLPHRAECIPFPAASAATTGTVGLCAQIGILERTHSAVHIAAATAGSHQNVPFGVGSKMTLAVL
jgi:hypothetical protein